MAKMILSAAIFALFAASSVQAAPYKGKCVAESTSEAKEEMSIDTNKAKDIATKWCDCFITGATTSGIKDDYDAMDSFLETAKGKALEKSCDDRAGWK